MGCYVARLVKINFYKVCCLVLLPVTMRTVFEPNWQKETHNFFLKRYTGCIDCSKPELNLLSE